MKDIVIIGAGGFGREVLWLLNKINRINKEYNFLGFIDDDYKNGEFKGNPHIIGDIDYLVKNFKDICVVIAIGNTNTREKIYDKIKKYNFEYPNIVSPEIYIDSSNKVGIGNIICTGSILTCDVTIGNFNIINLNCTIGHDDFIEDFITIYPNSNISGNVLLSNHVEVGTGSQIIQGIKIFPNTILGAGSVVVRDIEGFCTAVGVPAKIIKRKEVN